MATPDITELAEERLLTAYSEVSGSDKKQISPALAALLAQLAASLLSNCLKSRSAAEVKKLAARPVKGRALIRVGMLKCGYLNRPDADQIVEAMVKAAERSTAEEMTKYDDSMNFMV